METMLHKKEQGKIRKSKIKLEQKYKETEI